MKKRLLVTMTFMLIVVCGIFAVRTAIAGDCRDLEKENCVSQQTCTDDCTPVCGDQSQIVTHEVDKCKCKATGYDSCSAHPTTEVPCYWIADCKVGTEVCPTDTEETKCTRKVSKTDVPTSLKVLTGSGCE